MEGFTVKNANRFLTSGNFGGTGDQQSLRINNQGESVEKTAVGGASASAGNISFADTLKNAIDKVNDLQVASDKAIQNLATGRTDNVADVMIASERADIALKLMVQVRNKIIDAYQEVMKMQV